MEWEHWAWWKSKFKDVLSQEAQEEESVRVFFWCFIMLSFPVLSLLGQTVVGGMFQRVDKVIHRASRIVGRQLDNFQSVYRGKVLHKASRTLQDPSHPLLVEFYSWLSHRSSRVLLPNTKTNRYKYSFLPSVISVLNAKLDINMWLNNLWFILYICGVVCQLYMWCGVPTLYVVWCANSICGVPTLYVVCQL